MDEFSPYEPHRLPTARRPLLGLTVLVVEDSRFACDAMRLMCLRSGARIRRADCLQSARRHLQIYRPTVAVVDLGLPDGSGAELIEEMARASPRIDVILGLSGDDFAEDIALAAGADGFLAKPLASLATFQQVILAHLPAERQPTGPRPVQDEVIRPDPVAYLDDLAHVASTLDGDSGPEVIDYVTQFLTGLARSAEDRALLQAVENVSALRSKGDLPSNEIARLGSMIRARLTPQVAI